MGKRSRTFLTACDRFPTSNTPDSFYYLLSRGIEEGTAEDEEVGVAGDLEAIDPWNIG
ncbi:MAG: hypothetical protein AB1861_19370 [Cyanobacteriota bacterium]